jgi:hypothetical protein
MRLRITHVALAALMTASIAASGCHKAAKVTADAIEKSAAAVVQQNDKGTSTWIVGSDGAVSALLKGPDNKPVTANVSGTVTFTPPDGAPTTVPATFDPKTGVLVAAGPKLDADVTPVSYNLQVDGQPWNGALDVPRGGTVDLVETGKLQAEVPQDKLVGPNGGVVQMVGPDRVEVVANKSSGEVRAYVLGPDYQVIDPGDRKITLALEGPEPEVIVLQPQPNVRFFTGKVRSRVDPVHVTVAVNAHGATHACLVGWHPGVAVVVGPAAPPVHLYAVEAWPEEEIEIRGKHHHGHETVVVGEPGVVVGAPGVVVGAPGVVVGGPHVVVGAPGAVVVGRPGVVVGGPHVVVGAPGAVVVGGGHGGGGAVHVHGGGGGGRHR